MQDAVMPAMINWELVQSLYLKGLGPSQIEKQTGVKANAVSVRASRYGWRQHLAKASVIVTQHNKTIQGDAEDSPESNALAKSSALARTALSGELLRAVDTLTSTKPSKRLESQRERAGVVQTLASAAKTVYGWSEGQSQPSVRINVLSSFSVEPQAQPQVDSQPVIECESTPVLPPPSE